MASRYHIGDQIAFMTEKGEVVSFTINGARQANKPHHPPNSYARFIQQNFHRVAQQKRGDFGATCHALARLWKNRGR